MSIKKGYQPDIVPTQRPGKEGGARAKNREQRTQALCEAALELFLDGGIEATTVDDITRGAGVAKGSFYRYFSDKAAVVEALLSPLEAEMDGAMQRCEQRLRGAAEPQELTAAYAGLAAELGAMLFASPLVVKLYLQEARAAKGEQRRTIIRVREKLLSGAVALTNTAHERGLLKDLPPPVTAIAVVGAVEGLIAAYLDGFPLGDPASATDALISMVLDGIRNTR